MERPEAWVRQVAVRAAVCIGQRTRLPGSSTARPDESDGLHEEQVAIAKSIRFEPASRA